MPRLNAENSVEVAEIQRRMAQIRREMHADVQGAVRGAQSLTDWRTILGNHPWAAMGIAMGLGYLAVPHRSTEPHVIRGNPARALAEANQAVAAPRPSGSGKARLRPFGWAFNLLTPVLLRAAQNYALNHLEQWLAAHPLRMNENNRARPPEPGEGAFGETQAHTVRFPDHR